MHIAAMLGDDSESKLSFYSMKLPQCRVHLDASKFSTRDVPRADKENSFSFKMTQNNFQLMTDSSDDSTKARTEDGWEIIYHPMIPLRHQREIRRLINDAQ